MVLTEGSALVIQVMSVRLQLDQELKKLERTANIVISDPQIMRGMPVYRGTRIPLELIADMLTQGAKPDGILEGYPALGAEKIDLAPLYDQAFPPVGVLLLGRGRSKNRFAPPDAPEAFRGHGEALDR